MRSTIFIILVLASNTLAFAQVAPPGSDAEPIASADRPELLEKPRDDASNDQVTAAALFAHGRLLQQRRDFYGALRRYQRAWRYDVHGRGLKEIVALAIEAGRMEEAARYAALPGGEQAVDSLVLRRLAVDATNRRQYKLAAQLYEHSLTRSEELGLKTATHVLLKAELGRLYALTDEFERAAQSFAEVRAALAKPDDYDLTESIQKVIVGNRRDTYSLMARCSLEAGQYDDAATLYREAHQDAPESWQALFDQASIHHRRGQNEEAEKLLNQALSAADADPAPMVALLRPVLAKTLGDDQVESALEARLMKLQEGKPERASLRFELARTLVNQGKLDAAETLIAAATDDAGKELLAEVLRRQSKPVEWLKLAPTSESEIAAAASDPPFAEGALKLAADLKPGENRQSWRTAAVLAVETKKIELAQRFYDESLPAEDKARGEALVSWSLRLLRADEYQASSDVLHRVIEQKLVEDLTPVYFYLSGATALLGEHEAAIEAARKAREGRPKDIRFHDREAWALHHAKRNTEARKKYEELVARFEKSSDASSREELREARRILSAICLETGDHAAAVEWLEQVLDEFPEDTGANNDLGYLWADRGVHLQRSLRMVQKAVAAEPENRAFRDSLGWVYYRLERYAEAVAELEKAASGDNPGGLILDHLGDALAKAGRADDARAAWRRAQEAYADEGKIEAAAKAKMKEMTNDQ